MEKELDSIQWQPWLTKRQTEMIRDALVLYKPREDETEHYDKLFVWFDKEASIK